ncbi:EamA family transporter [Candidatus Bathyarchaeota archaeon]|nr:EamA family transporter [Candidatus Bathyarchaeota archaeon]
MNPVLLAVLSMLATGLSDFFYRRSQLRGASPTLFLAFQSVFFNVTNLTFVSYSGGVEISSLTILLGAACASLVYLSVYLFLRSLRTGETSINVPLFRLSFIVTAILGVYFFHEAVTSGKILAICLAVFSILTFSSGLRLASASALAATQLVLATILYGLFGFLYKLSLSMGVTPTGILIVQGLSFIIYAFLVVYLKGPVKWSRNIIVHAPLCGVLLSSSYLLLLESLKYGEVSVSFSIVQLSFMVTSILAILAWHEKPSPLGILGITSAVFAVAFFAYL